MPCRPSKFQNPGDAAEFFGTSKAFGFTKKNELFVGRVAMIGFASELLGRPLSRSVCLDIDTA